MIPYQLTLHLGHISPKNFRGTKIQNLPKISDHIHTYLRGLWGIHSKILHMVYHVKSVMKSAEKFLWTPKISEHNNFRLEFRAFFANNSRTEQDIVNQKSTENYWHSARQQYNLVYFGPLTKKLL